MGLDVSHGAFSASYSAFNRFRSIILKAIGGSWPPHDDPTLDPNLFYVADGDDTDNHPGLSALLCHSDCDGEISPEDCKLLADELEAILPKIRELDDGGAGHIQRDGGYTKVTEQFIAGCRKAYAANEQLRFC